MLILDVSTVLLDCWPNPRRQDLFDKLDCLAVAWIYPSVISLFIQLIYVTNSQPTKVNLIKIVPLTMRKPVA